MVDYGSFLLADSSLIDLSAKDIDINESNRLYNEEIFEEQEVMILRKNQSQSHSKEIALKSY